MKSFFRIIAFLEGFSYILLLFIAVPIKYWGGNDQWVKLLGMPHGILFVLYVFLAISFFIKDRFYLFSEIQDRFCLFRVSSFIRLVNVVLLIFLIFWFPLSFLIALSLKDSYQWKWWESGIVLLASILPFGTFYVEKKYF
tara:strand:- start:439 stop:858 length:420 start_codon:yes stop_codon:yes gene_type:complete